MKLINPWENIKIKKIGNKEVIQNFDDDIHLLYVLVGELSVESEGSYLTLQKDDFSFCINPNRIHAIRAIRKFFSCRCSIFIPKRMSPTRTATILQAIRSKIPTAQICR